MAAPAAANPRLTLSLLQYAIGVGSGALVGFVLGHLVGRLAIYLRARHGDTTVSPNDFLALALIALSYVCAELIGAWGFLATFAAGVGLRHAEIGKDFTTYLKNR